ncbi:hypothetical protein FJY93_01185 [Candidatus Kaiserbacteria bacterium]|nr:hypothetical protein [Candidatus Kaiserbacteria bacterium]
MDNTVTDMIRHPLTGVYYTKEELLMNFWKNSKFLIGAAALLVLGGLGWRWWHSSPTAEKPLAPVVQQEEPKPTPLTLEQLTEALKPFGERIEKLEKGGQPQTPPAPKLNDSGTGLFEGEEQDPQGDPRAKGPHRKSPAEIAADAYESLGPAPKDGFLKNHQVVGNNNSFTCPDGSRARLVKKVGIHARWACPHHD